MLRNTKGQIIIPTGGGKTMCMIDDAMNEFSRTVSSQTIVVVVLVFYLLTSYQQSSYIIILMVTIILLSM